MQENENIASKVFDNPEKHLERESNPKEVLHILREEYSHSFDILEKEIDDYDENITEEKKEALIADMMTLLKAARLMTEKIQQLESKK